MLLLNTPTEFEQHIGKRLGPTAWRTVTQAQISAYATLTGDDHWIHVDEERARRERPGGQTIAHGLYILSLIPAWQRDLFRIERRGAGLSYGYERVRFTAPVPVDTPIRLVQTVADMQPHRQGVKVFLTSTIEIEKADNTALVAEGILLIGSA